ncbi:hypothetical protein AZ54_20770 [Xanthomonas oryzae pv. oryzae PXO86]|nr:hypothetical protein AZ54_20770 [Xanthomonas oryzae pv. oryzae PXO86]
MVHEDGVVMEAGFDIRDLGFVQNRSATLVAVFGREVL